ncbi:MAG TPA: 50S ribosomal protein L6 [Amoebophilaceae bacterium]|nr:50S ribosomal protein L6 [Amoebophilaceae bacterium]
MSRIGKIPIKLPNNVTVTFSNERVVHVNGPKGALSQLIDPAITVKIEKDVVVLERKLNQKTHKALHGLYRSLLQNMVIGVSEGYRKTLELVGVGYKASVQNNVLELSLGYSHGIFFAVPTEIVVNAEMMKGKNPLVYLEGTDKQLVGQIAAKLRALRKVEPYKGKGIRFLGEQIRRKAGKSTAK